MLFFALLNSAYFLIIYKEVMKFLIIFEKLINVKMIFFLGVYIFMIIIFFSTFIFLCFHFNNNVFGHPKKVGHKYLWLICGENHIFFDIFAKKSEKFPPEPQKNFRRFVPVPVEGVGGPPPLPPLLLEGDPPTSPPTSPSQPSLGRAGS